MTVTIRRRTETVFSPLPSKNVNDNNANLQNVSSVNVVDACRKKQRFDVF